MKNPIDLSRLSIPELIELNHQVMARIENLHQAESYKTMAKLKVGDKVRFTPANGQTINGTILRLNKKTVSLCTDDHQYWKVSPTLLTKVTTRMAPAVRSNVLSIQK